MTESTVLLLAGLASYAGPVAQMPADSFGWTAPNRLRHEGEHLFFERDTQVAQEAAGEATLLVAKIDDAVHVFDDCVFMADRWWNFNHLDTYSYPHDYGVYVRSLNRGPEHHRDPDMFGRVIGSCGWGDDYVRFAGALHSMRVGTWGFVDMKQLVRSGQCIYLKEGTTVSMTLEGETCLQVIRLHDGFFVFDGDVPNECRWWDRPHASNYDAFRSASPTHVRGLFRAHQWRCHRLAA